MRLRRGWGSGLMALGVLIILASNFALPFLPFDAYPVTVYRGYTIYWVNNPPYSHYIIEGISGQYSTVSAAKAAIDDYLGPPPPENRAPVADADIPSSGEVGKTCYFYGDGSYDPDGDSLTYKWTFGDGGSSTSKNPMHKYSSTGTYSVKLVVSDGKLSDSDSGSISIKSPPPPPNQSPIAEANGPYSGEKGKAISFSGSGSSDPDGSIVEYRWAFGDGSSYKYGKTVSHTYSSTGTFTATLRVKDDDGATDSDSASVKVTSPPPPPPPKPSGYFTFNGVKVTDSMTLNTNSFDVGFVATAAASSITRVRFRAWLSSTLKIDTDLSKVDSTHWQKTVTLSDGVYTVQGDVYYDGSSLRLLSIVAGVGEDESDPPISPRLAGTLVGAAVFGIGAIIRFRQPKRRRRR